MSRGKHTPKIRSRVAVALLCACIAVASSCLLGGCKESDAIVERIYDQSSLNVDYDNPKKFYIPDDEARTEDDTTETTVEEESPWEDVVERDLPDSLGPESENQAPQTEYRAQSDTNALAPHTQAGDQAQRSSSIASPTAQESGTQAQSDATTPSQNELPSWEPTNAGDNGNEANGDQGSSDKDSGTQEGIKPVDPHDDTYLERVYDSTYGDLEDLPTDVKTIAAIDELATIAQVIGGTGTLVGSSEDYLGRQAVQDVFAKQGIADVKALWSGDGQTTTKADAEAIIRANPDACLVYSGQLGADLERLILQNRPDMRIITLPKPTSALNISVELDSIGRMLSESSNGASEERVGKYHDFVDRIVSEAESAHGGGEVTYASVDYNNNDSTRILTTANPSGAQLWSLYIEGWDEDAAVTATYESSVLFQDLGAAYTNTGWSWSPLSYYMSVGGVINNAAAFGPLSTELVQPVLTLNQNQVSYTWNSFCVNVDESRGGGGYSHYRAFFTLTNGRDAVDRGGINPNDLHPLGSDDFNTVIVKNSRIAERLTEAQSNDNGLYTLYPYESTASGSGYGRKFEGARGESIIYSTVKGDVGYRILVNPCGYVGSWTDGSIESPLEALWIANQFWGYDSSKLNDYITEFYSEFYAGYEPDVEMILNGSYAQDE